MNTQDTTASTVTEKPQPTKQEVLEEFDSLLRRIDKMIEMGYDDVYSAVSDAILDYGLTFDELQPIVDHHSDSAASSAIELLFESACSCIDAFMQESDDHN